MILKFSKRELAPGLAALAIQGNIHCGPECARLEREVDGMIAARETRVIFDMSGVTHADSAAIGSIVLIDYSLKLTKVDKIIGMFTTVEQASENFEIVDGKAGLAV